MKRPDSALHATAWHKRIASFRLSQERGAVAVEYALVASLIALVVIVGMGLLGSSLEAVYARVGACFADTASCMEITP